MLSEKLWGVTNPAGISAGEGRGLWGGVAVKGLYELVCEKGGASTHKCSSFSSFGI